MDLADADRIDRVLRRVEPDALLHTAALSRVSVCERSPALAAILNEHAVSTLARVCGSMRIRFLSTSTDLVFNGLQPPYTESSPISPVNVYGESKAAGEREAVRFAGNSVILRPALMYGAPAISGTSFSEWMRTEWRAGRATPLYTDQYRTPVFVEDLAAAMLDLAEAKTRGIFHLAGPERINRLDFGRLLAERLGFGADLIRPVRMDEVKVPGKRPPDVSLCSERTEGPPAGKFSSCREGIRRAYTAGGEGFPPEDAG